MTQQSASTPPQVIDFSSTWRKISLTIGCAICIVLVLWLSRILHVPGERFAAGAILQQSNGLVALGLAFAVIVGGSILGAIVTMGGHHEAGLFCGAAGLVTLSALFGPSRYVLFKANSPGIYPLMAGELVLLYLPVFITWIALHAWRRREQPLTASADPPAAMDQNIMATITHLVIMLVLVSLFCQTDVKAQSMAAVGLASYLAALGAHTIFAESSSFWFVAAPLIVGVIGYLAQYFGPNDWMIGVSRGLLGPLARPIPLDYASLGTAGALLGYWHSQAWHHERIAAE